MLTMYKGEGRISGAKVLGIYDQMRSNLKAERLAIDSNMMVHQVKVVKVKGIVGDCRY